MENNKRIYGQQLLTDDQIEVHIYQFHHYIILKLNYNYI